MYYIYIYVDLVVWRAYSRMLRRCRRLPTAPYVLWHMCSPVSLRVYIYIYIYTISIYIYVDLVIRMLYSFYFVLPHLERWRLVSIRLAYIYR